MMPTPPLPPIVTDPLPTPADVQHAVTTQGQRRINLIWEMTQATVAVMVVITNLVMCVISGLSGGKVTIPTLLPESLFLVIGFYFSRTNHTNTGGVGPRTDGGR